MSYYQKYQEEHFDEDYKQKHVIVAKSDKAKEELKESIKEFSEYLYDSLQNKTLNVAKKTINVLESDIKKLEMKKNHKKYDKGDVVFVDLPNRMNMMGAKHMCIILNRINENTYKVVPIASGSDESLANAYHKSIYPQGDKEQFWLVPKNVGIKHTSIAKITESLNINSGDFSNTTPLCTLNATLEGKRLFQEMSHYIAVLENGAQYNITARNREIIMLRQQNKEQKQQLEGVMKLTQKLNYLSSENDSLKIQHEKDKDIILDKNIQITALESEVEKHKAEYLEGLEKLTNLQRIIEQEVVDSKQRFEKLQNDYNQLNEFYNNLSSNVQELGYEVDNYGNISVLEYSYDIEH